MGTLSWKFELHYATNMRRNQTIQWTQVTQYPLFLVISHTDGKKTNSVIFIGFYFANVPLYGWFLLCFWGLRLPSAVGLF